MSDKNSDKDPALQCEEGKCQCKMPRWELDDDVVITGLSGRFPESSNVEELKEKLFSGVDMITEDSRRWKPGLFGTPKRFGKLKEIDKLDWLFFGVNCIQAERMDPMQRIFIEVAYEAIFDAGYEPSTLRGKNIGVFVGCSDKGLSGYAIEPEVLHKYDILGQSNSVIPNRVSSLLGFTGPSLVIDSACSSSLIALAEAIHAIRTNLCEAAVVGGTSVIQSVASCISSTKLGLLSPEGMIRVFDAKANGFVRSEAVGAVFLQRGKDARRCYATVLHCKINNDGLKPEGIGRPTQEMHKELLRECYREIGLHPEEIDYIEAHGTGTQAGDSIECNAIADLFFPVREKPLLIGSVKSNIGHCEPASGICGLSKVIISMEENIIPGNLHYETPNSNIPALIDGRLKVVSRNTPWKPGIVAISSFGFGGTNVHAVLKANQKEKPLRNYRCIPRLAFACGRTIPAVQHIFKKIQEDQYTDEALVLLEDACKVPTQGMPYRGYALVEKPGDNITAVIKTAPSSRRQVWFLFSGLGSQWTGMARDLMKLNVFARSIENSAQILKPYNVDLLHLLTNATAKELEDIIAPFVTIAAVQIALFDVVKSLSVSPNGIIGHSLGETVSAYADGCLTAEQALLSAYWKGKCCTMTKLIHGAMAVADITWDEAKRRCPEGVYTVCHNTADNVTISGPALKVRKFLEELNSEKIFTKEVNSCDIAFHTPYVKHAAEIMGKELEKIIQKPLPRSNLWVSSSVPEGKWNEPEARLSSADYQINNMLNPVLFKEALEKVPKSAIIIEIAPHKLLQTIVKRGIGPNCIYIGLMERNNKNNLVHCLNAIGEMYTAGINPTVKNLYDPIHYPVPRGTQMLNSLIQWDHSTKLLTWSSDLQRKMKNMIPVNTNKGEDDEYILGHKIDGRILYPFTGYIYLVWQAVAKSMQMITSEVPLIIHDLTVSRASILPMSGVFNFRVFLEESSGTFNILDGNTVVASGTVAREDRVFHKINDENFLTIPSKGSESITMLNSTEAYKELRLRGYQYGSTFQNLLKASVKGELAMIKWSNNWVTHLDAILQFHLLTVSHRALLLPQRVKTIRIDPRKQPQMSQCQDILVEGNAQLNSYRTDAVEIEDIFCVIAPKRSLKANTLVIENVEFLPMFDSCMLTEEVRNIMEEYDNVCSTLAYKISNILNSKQDIILEIEKDFREVPDSRIKKLLKQDDEKFILLRILNEVLGVVTRNGTEEEVRSVITTFSESISNDFLSSQTLIERSLRSALDIVQENHTSRRLRILEVSRNCIVQNEVLKMLNLTKQCDPLYDYRIEILEEISVSKKSQNTEEKSSYLPQKQFPSENNLVVAKNIFTDTICNVGAGVSVLEAMIAALKPGGFILLLERIRLNPGEILLSCLTRRKKAAQEEPLLERLFQMTGLSVISKKNDNVSSVLYLLRKNLPISFSQDRMLIDISDDEKYFWVDELNKALKQNEIVSSQKRIWLTTTKSDSGIIGLMKSLKEEQCGEYLRFFVNFDGKGIKNKSDLKFSEPFYKEMFDQDLVFNCIYNGQWGMFRHRTLPVESTPQVRQHAFLSTTKYDNLSSIKWIQEEPRKQKKGMESVDVYYTALNFRDIMQATGKLPRKIPQDYLQVPERYLGLEFSGRDSTGRRVMGMIREGALATSVSATNEQLIDVPDHWTLEEASTVVVAYMTSYFSLFLRGNLQRGESVLIHSGAGSVGLSAIRLALSMECKVFTTVGSEGKKNYLTKLFPELRGNIFHSRDDKFRYDILNATKGKGVDVVLNSLSDDRFHASMACMAPWGRFLEIGNIQNNTKLGMLVPSKNISFIVCDLELVGSDTEIWNALRRLLTEGIQAGVVRPLKANTFSMHQAEGAFRLMASGNHTGKVVIKIRDEEDKKVCLPSRIGISCAPRAYFDSDKCYIVTGGLGGLGFELVRWIIERGAKKVILSSRSGIKDNYQNMWIQRWRAHGCEILSFSKDITNPSGCESLFQVARDMGPVGGIFHLAAVLHDNLFQNLNAELFVKVSLAKVQGVRQLDRISRELCPELDFFVVFSSYYCGRGNPGQSINGYANSVMERIVEKRRSQGLPGLAIQWGLIDDVGITYERSNEVLNKRGIQTQSLESLLNIMDRFLQEENAVVSCFIPSDKSIPESSSDESVYKTICRILGLPTGVKPETILGDLGMDSLMGVELKQTLEIEHNVFLSVSEIRKISIKDLENIAKNNCSQKEEENNSLAIKLDTAPHTKMLVSSKTLVSMNESECKKIVFFLQEFTGRPEAFLSIARNINSKVYGLHLHSDILNGTVQDLAKRYVQEIKAVQPHGPYSLVGFGFSVAIAVEIALILQKTDHVMRLLAVGSSPDALVEIARKTSNKIKELNEASGGVFHILSKNVLPDAPEDPIPKELNALFGNRRNENDFLMTFEDYQKFFKLTEELATYVQSGKLRGNTVLVKPKEFNLHLHVAAMDEEDFGMKKGLTGSLEVLTADFNPFDIVDDHINEISKIINDRT